MVITINANDSGSYFDNCFDTKLVMGGYLEGSMHPFSKDKSFGKGMHLNINSAPPISSKMNLRVFSLYITKVKGKRRGLYKYSSSEKNRSKEGILGCESILVAASLSC